MGPDRSTWDLDILVVRAHGWDVFIVRSVSTWEGDGAWFGQGQRPDGALGTLLERLNPGHASGVRLSLVVDESRWRIQGTLLGVHHVGWKLRRAAGASAVKLDDS